MRGEGFKKVTDKLENLSLVVNLLYLRYIVILGDSRGIECINNKSKKSEIVFNSICQGLRMIADFDHLNSDSIERAIDIVKVQGLDIELVYMEKENKNYEIKIVYNVPRVVNQKALFELYIKDKNSQKECHVNIDYFDLWYVPYSISQIKIRKKEILIEGRKSLRAEISRKHDNLPDKYSFVIDEILL